MKNTMKKPVNIPVSKLRLFEGHPFKVKDDAEMNTLIESVQTIKVFISLSSLTLKGCPSNGRSFETGIFTGFFIVFFIFIYSYLNISHGLFSQACALVLITHINAETSQEFSPHGEAFREQASFVC